MTKKDDESRIDTIGRVIARPQEYSGEFGDWVFSKFHSVFGDLGIIVLNSALALVAFYITYRWIVVGGGIVGWGLGLYTGLIGLVFVAIAFIYAVFWRLDEGESTTVLGISFHKE